MIDSALRFSSVHPGGGPLLPTSHLIHIFPQSHLRLMDIMIIPTRFRGILWLKYLIYTSITDHCEIGTNTFATSADGCRVGIY